MPVAMIVSRISWESTVVSIDSVVRTYNEAAGSLESRVLVSARRMKDLGATAVGEIEVAGARMVLPRERLLIN